jgi:hypothetical protein
MAISQVSGLPKLSIVDLYGSSNITDAAVQVCRRVPFSVPSIQLFLFFSSFFFCCCFLSPPSILISFLQSLAQLAMLRYLNLQRCRRVTDVALAELARKAPALQVRFE